MADANLLEILDREPNGLKDMIVYGKVRCAIERPSFLSKSVELKDGFFALLDVLAFRCNGEDYFSKYSDYQDSKHIYFSRGSMVIVLNEKDLIGKNIRVYGRSLKGCTVKKQRTNNIKDGIAAFAWVRDNVNGTWCIAPNIAKRFGVSDAKGTVLEDYIVSLVSEQEFSFTHPDSVNGIMEYEGVSNVVPIELNEVKGGLEYSTEPVDLATIPMNLVHRIAPGQMSESAEMVGNAVLELRAKSRGYAKDLVWQIKDGLSDDEQRGDDLRGFCEGLIDNFVDRVASRYNIAIRAGFKEKGKDYVDYLVDNLAVTLKFKGEERDEGKEYLKVIEDLRKAVALDSEVLRSWSNSIPNMRHPMKYATLIIATTSGIGVDSLVGNYYSANRYNDLDLDEWLWCLIRNPYLCGLMGGNLNLHDCDRLFLGYSYGYDFDDCMKYRDMLVVLDAIKNASGRSTIVRKNEVTNACGTYPAIGKRYIDANGTPFKLDTKFVTEYVTDEAVDLGLCKKVFSRVVNARKMLVELTDVGLTEEVNGGIILSSDLRKEYLIYSKLMAKGSEETGIEQDNVEATIEKFEADRGFNLEALQKDGIQIVKYKAGILSGCAGSGKTTTSDCMVMAIEDYLPGYKLRFGAPTGKAARRLAEVVGGNVKTIHSMFGLGLSGEPHITVKDRVTGKSYEGNKYAYFLDEMAMCNTGLMYEIVEHLNDDDLVYFLGDVKQLPPIGKGSPFKSLMQCLPCVELGVSKRAAANGKINYNCGLINFVSDEKLVELQPGDDFDIIGCSDAEIQRKTVDLFREYLKDFSEDDIQVVTGYQTDKYPWSTVNLNPLLQKVLRKPSEKCFTYKEKDFMVNDRVIHVRKNSYIMPRYRRIGTSAFEEVVTFGVVNGELGKIVGCISSNKVEIRRWQNPYADMAEEDIPEDMLKLIEKRREYEDDLRDDSGINDENSYFVLVQVYDVDLMEDVYVFYRASYKEKLSEEHGGRVFAGGDLSYLELAYALTTHKMQGSQSPAIIFPLGAQGNVQFMNRNMINTSVTRSQKKVALIGSVIGRNSALTNGRRVTSIDDCNDMLSLLC